MKAKANSANKRLVASASTVAIAVVLYACGGDSGGNASMDVSKGTVLLNANVVNTRDGSVSPGMSIVIDAGKIQQIIPASTRVAVSGSGQAIDASGKFVVPGYNDMHSHSMAYANQTPTVWPLLIANGVTGIREMSGTPELIKAARQLNIDSAAGKVDAPEILQTTGPTFSGINTVADALTRVQQAKTTDYDFIKMFQASRDAAITIYNEAKKAGLTVAGHLPGASISAVEASSLGMRSFEHNGAGYGFQLDCAADEANIRKDLVDGKGAPTPYNPSIATYRVGDAPFYQRIVDTYSESKCKALAQTFIKNDSWVTPTLIRLHTINRSQDATFQNDPNLVYVDKGRRAVWAAYGKASAENIPPTAQASFDAFWPLIQKVTRLMKDSGVKMMTGTEVTSTLIIPGFSMHQEFRELTDAGFKPLEILQMATLNPAEFLHREATMGTVDAGKNADLVVLDANPMADVANMSKIAAVVLKGKYFPKAVLEQQKASVAAAYANAPATVAAFIDPTHND